MSASSGLHALVFRTMADVRAALGILPPAESAAQQSLREREKRIASGAIKSIDRSDSQGFFKNLAKIAAGEVAVVAHDPENTETERNVNNV